MRLGCAIWKQCSTVVQAISKPLNVVMSAADPGLTAAEMEAVGVKRLSVALHNAASAIWTAPSSQADGPLTFSS